MEASWLASMLCRAPCIMGRELQPFSLAHSFILERAENPYWIGGEKRAEHFFEAVDICSRTWEQNIEAFSKPRYKAFRKWAASKIYKTKAEDVDAFITYLENFSGLPEREGSGDGEELVSPYQFRLVTWLMSKGITESRAWNMPFSLAFCYFYSNAEREGDKSLVPEWKADANEVMQIANKLLDSGEKEKADKLYAYVQDEFNRHRGAKDALKAATNG